SYLCCGNSHFHVQEGLDLLPRLAFLRNPPRPPGERASSGPCSLGPAPGSSLAVLAHHPAQGGLFAESPPPILVTNPVLVRHPLLRAVKLLHEFLEFIALQSQFIHSIFHGSSVTAIGAIGIHCAERQSLNGHANELTNDRLTRRSIEALPKIHRRLQDRLRGSLIAR